MCDPYSAAFQILDSTGTQIYPVTPGTKQSVNLVTHRVGLGYYAAVWTSSAAAVGAYTIRWSVVPVVGDEEVVFDQSFEVVTKDFPGRNYCSLQSLRDDGITASAVADDVAQRLIVQASRMVEMYTGRVFAPVPKTVRVDGNNSRRLLFQEPIVAIESLTVSLFLGILESDLAVLPDTFLVYNRHLSMGLLQPDDRDNPKIEFVYDANLEGAQNIEVVGVFGYTEPDGSWCGRTPELIQVATRLLCFRYRAKPGTDDRDDDVKRGRIISEHTKDQGYQLANMSMFGGYTADPEIDGILSSFTRPPKFGAV